jgi:hypothetical protein
MNTEFTGKSQALTLAGLTRAASGISVDPEELWTVVAVETSGCGFLPDRRPSILFERHVFYRLTGGRFSNEDISNPTPGGYGPSGAAQYERLAAALALDRTAGLKSASWGIGQIMGENFAMSEFDSVGDMVLAMADSEDAQIGAMSAFIGKLNLAPALRRHEWRVFASRYNGPGYAANQYDVKLATAFGKYSSGALPDLNLRAVQLYLTFCGYSPGAVDGIPGARTQSAIIEFQRKKNLREAGGSDNGLIALLRGEL